MEDGCQRIHLALPTDGVVSWRGRSAQPAADEQRKKRAALGPEAGDRPTNRFQQIIQDMERKYATSRMPVARPPPKRARQAEEGDAAGAEGAGGGSGGPAVWTQLGLLDPGGAGPNRGGPGEGGGDATTGQSTA